MSKKNFILSFFVLLKFLLQYHLISPEYDLHRDEYLHLDQAYHLDWGYTSVPPVTSWFSWIIMLLGGSVFWVKFFPPLFGALTLVVVWKTIEALQGNLYALVLGTMGVLLSALLRVNILYQPNSLDILCWTSMYYVVIRWRNSTDPKWWYIGAMVLSLGFLNKYNIVFLLLGLLPALAYGAVGKLLFNKHLFYAAGLALLLILPNLIWQYWHGFPVLQHLEELAETQLVHVDRVGFLKSQVLFFVGALFILICGLYALGRHERFAPYRFFLWILPFTLGIFLYFRAKDYYAMGLYPVYIAFGASYLGEILPQRHRYVQLLIFVLPVLLFIPMYLVAFPNKSPLHIAQHPRPYSALGMLRWEDGKEHAIPQDFADMLGWEELAMKVDQAYKSLPAGKILILCDNYGQAGAINYYSKLNLEAVSFNADYINWFDLSTPYVHVIRVINNWEKEEEFNGTKLLFESAHTVGTVTHPSAREYGTAICTFVQAKVDINKIIKEEIASKKHE